MTNKIKELNSKAIDPVYVREFLSDHGFACESIFHQPSLTLESLAQQLLIPLPQFARMQLLRDSKGYVMAILPLDSSLDFLTIKNELGRDFEMAWPEEYSALFSKLNSHSIPPLSGLFGMESILDADLIKNSFIYLPDGSGEGLLKMSSEDFVAIQNEPKILNMAIDLSGGQLGKGIGMSSKSKLMREKIANLDSLPPMPDVASKLLNMSTDPETMAEDIAAVIETDPAIVAQVMHYARSPWYGYKGEINSVEEAIFSILGMDMVTNVALGMSAGKVFSIPSEGALSAPKLWKHSVYCAALTEGLSRAMPVRYRVKPGTAYLSGLLHNIGFMIVAHCFGEEFHTLSMQVEEHPEDDVTDIELQLYGMSHTEIGAELMRRWNLPEKVIQVMRHHHNEQYDGEHQKEVLLVLLANRILAGMNIGDEKNTKLSAELLEKLGLDEETVCSVVESIFEEHSAELDAMVTRLAA